MRVPFWDCHTACSGHSRYDDTGAKPGHRLRVRLGGWHGGERQCCPASRRRLGVLSTEVPRRLRRGAGALLPPVEGRLALGVCTAFAHSRRERAPRDWNLLRDHVNLQPPRKTPGQRGDAGFGIDRQTSRPPRQPHTSSYSVSLLPEARCKEAHLSNSARRSARFTAQILLALGALNAWTAQERDDYGLCLRSSASASARLGCSARTSCNVATAGIERVLAHIAVHPGAATQHFAQGVGASERATSIYSPTRGCWLALVTDGAHPATRSYRLAP